LPSATVRAVEIVAVEPLPPQFPIFARDTITARL